MQIVPHTCSYSCGEGIEVGTATKNRQKRPQYQLGWYVLRSARPSCPHQTCAYLDYSGDLSTSNCHEVVRNASDQPHPDLIRDAQVLKSVNQKPYGLRFNSGNDQYVDTPALKPAAMCITPPHKTSNQVQHRGQKE